MHVKPLNTLLEQLLAGMLLVLPILSLEGAVFPVQKKGRKNRVDPSQLGNSCVSITLCQLPTAGRYLRSCVCVCLHLGHPCTQRCKYLHPKT